MINGVPGVFTRSTNFIGASSWIASPFALQGSLVCTSLHSDDMLSVANAAQWTVAHQGINTSSSTPPPIRKLIFMRGGTEWQNTFSIDLGIGVYSGLQLSIRENATSAGDFTGTATGTIPVFQFQSGLTGVVTFSVTVNMLGRFAMVLSAKDGSANYSMFEMEWHVVE